MTIAQLTETRNRVNIALRNLNPTGIFFDLREGPEFLRIQVISEQFRGIDLADRIGLVVDHLDDLDPDIFGEFLIRVECYTRDGWERVPTEERGQ